MIDEDEAAEITAANDALKRSLVSLTNADQQLIITLIYTH
jgi:hypothetical protein